MYRCRPVPSAHTAVSSPSRYKAVPSLIWSLENGIYFNESFQEEAEVEQLLSGVQQAEKSYTVQNGDTIWSIAQKNGLTVKELCEMNTGFTANGENGLTQDSKILPGDALTVVREEEMLEVVLGSSGFS